MYIKQLNDIYTHSSMAFHLYIDSKKINIRTGVREENTIWPKLFTAALENIFRRLIWETRGLQIDNEYLSHIRCADDILVCANTPHELQQMLQELVDDSENQVLKMNKLKTRVMMENDSYVNNNQIKNVESYIFLGQRYSSEAKTNTKLFKLDIP